MCMCYACTAQNLTHTKNFRWHFTAVHTTPAQIWDFQLEDISELWVLIFQVLGGIDVIAKDMSWHTIAGSGFRRAT